MLAQSSFLPKYTLKPSFTPFPCSKITATKIDENKYPNTISTHRAHAVTSSTNTSSIPQQRKSLSTIIFNIMDELICKFLDPPLHRSIDPKQVLSGNFAPVDELPPTVCSAIEGSLPSCLNGAYIRNGSNPQFIPKGPYHIVDGDGMLHAVTISNGRVKFCSRFVKTYKYLLEKEIGAPVIMNYGSAFTNLPASLARCLVDFIRVRAGQYDPDRGFGGANTSLAFFSRKLFALDESDLPYSVKLTSDGDIITLGREESFRGPNSKAMTAHPKIDPDTGEAFAFCYDINPPFLTYFVINGDGTKKSQVPIFSMKQATVIHDFAITKNYVVFPESQFVINPKNILSGKMPAGFDPEKVTRLGIIPRYAAEEKEMLWIEAPELNMLHVANAWEEDGGQTVVLVGPNVHRLEQWLEKMDLLHPELERIEINVNSKTVTRRLVAGQMNLDFGVINPAYLGKKNRLWF